ncbi:MAG: (d)CMP kinase [Defluviitaleaceae bacterium]|nr:(d)CMP kinase [Defluviitaleaceae bacterium]
MPDNNAVTFISIAIDGPSGAGKSSAARAAARELGFVYADTGAMYRAVALHCLRSGLDVNDEDAVAGALEAIHVELAGERQVLLNGEDVSGHIRTQEVSDATSRVSAIPAVRAKLVLEQKKMARSRNIVMDGRDICTKVLPDAQVKIFMDAKPETRAERRMKELALKGIPCEYEIILAEINERDLRDSMRPDSPLVRCADSEYIDTGAMTEAEVAAKIVELARNHLGKEFPRGVQ